MFPMFCLLDFGILFALRPKTNLRDKQQKPSPKSRWSLFTQFNFLELCINQACFQWEKGASKCGKTLAMPRTPVSLPSPFWALFVSGKSKNGCSWIQIEAWPLFSSYFWIMFGSHCTVNTMKLELWNECAQEKMCYKISWIFSTQVDCWWTKTKQIFPLCL